MNKFLTKTNLFLSLILSGAIVFSVVNITFAITPNPGHSANEVDFPQAVKTSDYAITIDDSVVYADATSNAINLILLSANIAVDKILYIKKTDRSLSNIVTITPAAGQNIDGFSNIKLKKSEESVLIQSDGSNWNVLSRSSYDSNAYQSRGVSLNQWYTSPSNGTSLTTGAPNKDIIFALPYIVSKPMVLDGMAIRVSTARGGSSIRLGIYSDNGNNYPGSLVVDAGTRASDSTGVKTYTISISLEPGLYWLVYLAGSNNPSVASFQTSGLLPILGHGPGLNSYGQYGWTVDYPFATLPSIFPTNATTIATTPIPAVFVRSSQ